jgi:hypothetical protein
MRRTVFLTAVVTHHIRTVPRSAFGPPQDDIAVRDGMTVFCVCTEVVTLFPRTF